MDALPLLPTMGVGSYASPGWFIAGRRQSGDGSFGPADVEELFDDATRIAVADQIEAGLDLITDGELRRQRFVYEMFGRLSGLTRLPAARKLGIPGYDQAPHFVVDGKITAPKGLGVVEEFRHLQRLAPGRRLKVALPGPLTFAGPLQPKADSRRMIADLVRIVRHELTGLVEAGAAHVQLDEPGLATPPAGMSAADCATIINDTLRGFATHRAVHVCFGNNAGRPIADRRLGPLLEALQALDCEQLVLEFANREMAELAEAGALARRHEIAAGVIDVKSFHLETPQRVAERIELCLRHIPAERLWLTADCGFSALPRALARAKLTALVDGARLARERLNRA
jgi:5-methyltetrahydropteroyltriglutamate--homocysteine methyltransferase